MQIEIADAFHNLLENLDFRDGRLTPIGIEVEKESISYTIHYQVNFLEGEEGTGKAGEGSVEVWWFPDKDHLHLWCDLMLVGVDMNDEDEAKEVLECANQINNEMGRVGLIKVLEGTKDDDPFPRIEKTLVLRPEVLLTPEGFTLYCGLVGDHVHALLQEATQAIVKIIQAVSRARADEKKTEEEVSAVPESSTKH